MLCYALVTVIATSGTECSPWKTISLNLNLNLFSFFIFNLIRIFYFMSVGVYLRVCLCVPGVCGGWNRAYVAPELEL